AIADKDFERAAAVVQWSGGGGSGRGVTLQAQIHDQSKAAPIQEKLIMRQLLDTVRTTDVNKPKSLDMMMKTLQALTAPVAIIENVEETVTFKPQLDQMAKVMGCMPHITDSLPAEEKARALTEGAAAKTKINEDRNHRFHKICFFLPAGRHIAAKIDELVLQSKQDLKCPQNLDKPASSISTVPVFAPKTDADLRGPIVIDNRKNLKTFCINALELDGKLSEGYKQLNASKMKQVFDHRDAIVNSIVAHCRHRQKVALEDAVTRVNQVLKLTDGLSGNVDGEFLTKISESFDKALTEFGSMKQLGINDIAGVDKAKEVDELFQSGKVAAQHLKELIPAIAEVSKKKKTGLDVRTAQVKGLADYFAQLGPRAARVASWAGEEVAKFEGWMRTEVTKALSTKVVQTTAPFQRWELGFRGIETICPSSFAKLVAEWLDKAPEQTEGQPEAVLDPELALHEGTTTFLKVIFLKEKVGEVTELASLARLGVYFDKFAKWLGVGFVCNTSPTALRAGLLILTQPILHVGQRVVKSDDVAKTFNNAELSSKGDVHIKTMQDIHSSVQFVALAEKMVNSMKSAEGLGPRALERAVSILKASRDRFDAAATAVLDSGVAAGASLITDFQKLMAGEKLTKLTSLCNEGDYTTDRINNIMDLVKSEEAVEYYRTFKKSQKAKTCLENIRKTAITIKDTMNIEIAVAKLDACIGTYTGDEYASYHNVMGILLCSQTIWRDLQPGESRDAMAEQCLKTVEDLTIPAPLGIALKQLSTKEK
ncbi:unnamed protein product, partial [Prorocentrum cordatum]